MDKNLEFRDIQRQRTEDLENDHTVNDHNNIDQKLETEGRSYHPNATVHGKSIEDIVAEAKHAAEIAGDHIHQNDAQ